MSAAVAEVAGRTAGQAGSRPSSSWGLEEGDRVAERLTALAKLGGGHHCEAYLAWDDERRCTVVAKLLRPDRAADAHSLDGLRAEAEALAGLQHPVIVRGFGARLGGPRPHLLLEHLEGPRLSSLIRRSGPLAIEQLAPLATQLAAAIHYMHGRGWLHLDVKPANVIMGAPPRLIDLSVACRSAAAAALAGPVGTDSYMAPEQCLLDPAVPLGAPADVFGLGVTLYRAASGERPFAPGDADAADPEQRWPQLTSPPVPLQASLPRAAVEMIEACLRFDPAARPAPAELGGAFESLLASLPRPRLGRLKPRWS